MDDEGSETPSYWGRIRPASSPSDPSACPTSSSRNGAPSPRWTSAAAPSPPATHRRGSRLPRRQRLATPLRAELAWRAGDKVRHRRFGDGIVVTSQWVSGDEEVTVAFAGQGVRRLIGSYAGLERLG